MRKKFLAELLGTAWLIFCGCGTVVISSFQSGIGPFGVAMAFGLALLSMSYAIGHVSGSHLNPAVTVGLALAKRFLWKNVIPYIIAQVAGACLGASLLYLVASGYEFFNVDMGFAANGYEQLSPRLYNLFSAFMVEWILTFFFLFIIIGVTSRRAPSGLAPIAIGFAYALMHMVSMPITNTSMNPARSTSQALFFGGLALHQLWLFWLAPMCGAAAAGLFARVVYKDD